MMISNPALKTQQLQVDGMDCGSCAKTIEASLQQLTGIVAVSVSFAARSVKVSYDPQQVGEAEIRKRISALAAADISFAVGGIDIALETADVVLVGSDLRKLAYAVDLSRRTVSIIQQNVMFSLVTKGLFLLLGTFGFVGLATAVLADTGTSLLVTANGMRLFKPQKTDEK